MDINAQSLFMDIVTVVIVPIVLGVIGKTLFRKQAEASAKALPLVSTSAIFSVWHNISGSILATWFSKREET